MNAAPGGGPTLHRHAYAEVFPVEEEQARFTAGDETLDVTGGHIVVVLGVTPHRIVNSGSGELWSVNAHAAGKIVSEWLEERREE